MATDADAVWAANIVSKIQAVGVTDSQQITNAQLIQVWQAVKNEDKVQLGKADVAPGSFANGFGPVVGTGGPVS